MLICSIKSRWLSLTVLLLILSHAGYCQEMGGSRSEDNAGKHQPKDEQEERRWLPIPLFFTEPAIGYGLGLGLGYFHPSTIDTEPEEHPLAKVPKPLTPVAEEHKAPPLITAVAGGYTDTGSWFGGLGHSSSWRDDTFRYAGALVYAELTSQYFILDQPVDFDLQGGALYQEAKFRIGDSRFFGGSKLRVLQTVSQFNLSIGERFNLTRDLETTHNIGLALELSYDGRDNVFTPNRGQLLQLSLWRHDNAFGSDYEYWNGTLKALYFHQLRPDFVLGLRLEASLVDGRPPLYAYPWIGLRGIPALRYQGKGAGVVEVEGRWNILPDWAIVGFIGAGAAKWNNRLFDSRSDVFAAGIGGRYRFLPEQGLWLGADIARGPEDWNWYINVGHAW